MATQPNPADLFQVIRDLETRLQTLETTNQIGHASVPAGGSITLLDSAGATWGRLGTLSSGGVGYEQWVNGSYTNVGAAATPGLVSMFASGTVPNGWLICDGSAVSRTTYAGLFTVIGTTYGAGNGSTTFTLPNLKGRVPVGLDAAQTEFNAMGDVGGSKTHTLSVNELPSHVHGQVVTANTGGPAARVDWSGDAAGQIYDQGVNTEATGGGAAHNNLQPFIVLNFIIKT